MTPPPADRRPPVDARWPAAPAAVALAACGLLTAVVLLRGPDPSPDTLRARADRAAAAGDDTTALLHQQHLLALEPDRPQNAVAMARTLDRLKRRSEAVAVLSTVAPLDSPGYAPAHLLLAEWAVEARVLGGQSDPQATNVARQHATAAAQDPSTAVAADALLRVIDGL